MSNVIERPRPSQSLPMAEIPFSQERLPRLKPDLLNTAGHELNHALIARELGVAVALVSVKPEGHSLGRTIFYGRVTPDAFKLIAAGGAIDPPKEHGPARGYGGDFRQIENIDEALETTSPNIIERAGSYINLYSEDVRKKAGEIVAFIGMKRDILGGELGDIIRRAEFEVRMENHQPILSDEKPRPEPQLTPEDASKYTIIEHMDNGMFHIKYSENNLIEKEFMFCGECGELDGHTSTCSNAKTYNGYKRYNDYKNYTEHPLKNTMVIARIPKEGRIFDSN